MGVFLLRSYCEGAELYKQISLPNNSSGKPRVVVFDAPGALRSFLRPPKRGLLYDFHHQQTKVRNMVRAFRSQGYELVVFLDCAIPDEKLTTWYRRRSIEASTLRKMNQHLSSQPPKPLPDGLWLTPNGALQILGDAFAEAGCKVFFSFEDSDKEAAYWAKQNKAYAIITDDTDFLCYDGVDRIWAANMKLPTTRSRTSQIRVSELQRQRLLDSLGLNQTQLQQLAGLLGNDHIKHISKDKVAQLKEQNAGQHVVKALAKQVLQLQGQLGGSDPIANGAASATASATVNGDSVAAVGKDEIDAAVKQCVAAAVANVLSSGGAAAADDDGDRADMDEDAATEIPAAAADAGIEPAVAAVVAQAFANVVAAAEDEEDEDEVGHVKGEHEEENEEGEEEEEDGECAASAAAGGAAATASLVDRCQRAMQQYSFSDVSAPIVVGNGDRWLLMNKGILMRGMGLEDMSKTPSHVVLQPLRMAVYASLGLSTVTEYMCVPEEKWRDWAAGRVVTVEKDHERDGSANRKAKKRPSRAKGSDKGAAGAGAKDIDPAVRKAVAAMFANVLGTAGITDKPAFADAPAAAEGAAEAVAEAAVEAKADGPEAEAEAEPQAAAVAEEQPAVAAVAEDDAPVEAGEDSAAAAAAAASDDIDPAVRKLVAAALSKAVAAGKKQQGSGASSSSRASAGFDSLPKSLPHKPLELATLICRRLRSLDPHEEQFSKLHEKLLLLQISHRQAALTAMHAGHIKPSTVRLPDLHAANLFLQAHQTLQVAQDGKLPKITSLLHVEVFHTLCQHPDLTKKVEAGPSDAATPRQQQQPQPQQQQRPRGVRQPGQLLPGRAAHQQPGVGGYQQRVAGGQQHHRARDAAAAAVAAVIGGRGPHRGPYQPPIHGGGPGGGFGPGGRGGAAGAAGPGGRGLRQPQMQQPYVPGVNRQQRGEPLTWQQRQAGMSAPMAASSAAPAAGNASYGHRTGPREGPVAASMAAGGRAPHRGGHSAPHAAPAAGGDRGGSFGSGYGASSTSSGSYQGQQQRGYGGQQSGGGYHHQGSAGSYQGGYGQQQYYGGGSPQYNGYSGSYSTQQTGYGGYSQQGGYGGHGQQGSDGYSQQGGGYSQQGNYGGGYGGGYYPAGGSRDGYQAAGRGASRQQYGPGQQPQQSVGGGSSHQQSLSAVGGAAGGGTGPSNSSGLTWQQQQLFRGHSGERGRGGQWQ